MKTLAISHTETPPNYKPVPLHIKPTQWTYCICWQAWLQERKRLRETRPEVIERLAAIRAVERQRRIKEAKEEQEYWRDVKEECNCGQFGS